MDILLLIARLLLAVVFLIAAVAKLRDRSGTIQSIIDFGLPASLAVPLWWLLPFSELAIALALLPPPTAWWGALGALLLLLAFSVGIGVNLARGRKPVCHCFGELDSAPIGPRSLLRNAILGDIALLIVVLFPERPAWSVLPSAAELAAAGWLPLLLGVLLVVVLVVAGLLLARLWRENQSLRLRVTTLEAQLADAGVIPSLSTAPRVELPIGAHAPAFLLDDLDGEPRSLDTLRAGGNPVLLVFADPDCAPCQRLLPDVGRWQADYGDDLTIALISTGAAPANRALGAEHGLSNILLQKNREVAEAYRIRGTPSAVLIRPDGAIGNTTAAGAEEITLLATRAINQSGSRVVG